MKNLFLDIETYSATNLKECGAYKYIEDENFEILLLAYAFDNNPVQIIDITETFEIPKEIVDAIENPFITKHAWNANFERICFEKHGIKTNFNDWACTMVKSAYVGLPLSLAVTSKILKLGEKGKLGTGKALIKHFCVPRKPTKSNPSDRNYAYDYPEKWKEFKKYCINDVVSEREIYKKLEIFELPEEEKKLYVIDQVINDIGIKTDIKFNEKCIEIDLENKENLFSKMREITNAENPNSPAQLKRWLSKKLGKEINTLAKDKLNDLIKEVDDRAVKDLLELRKLTSKTSVKKYYTLLKSVGEDSRVRGLLQFYGANRTGRWAGRLVQVHNLPRNKIEPLADIRKDFYDLDFDTLELIYDDDISNILSQLIRTALVSEDEHKFIVSDFSAIEARVLAWLSGEEWRLEVFRDHGKIYEASSSKMFNVPIEEITKESDLRYKGKVAELSLGYQGGVGALVKMGADKMGLSEPEMKTIVSRWRLSNPMIARFWKRMEQAAIIAVRDKRMVKASENISFSCHGDFLSILLPSKRRLYYYKPEIFINQWEKPAVRYWGMNQTTKKFELINTYGGKLTENITQAVARDLLAYSIINLDKAGFKIVMHVHDEIVCETLSSIAKIRLQEMSDIMAKKPDWAENLPLGAEGYITSFYKKG